MKYLFICGAIPLSIFLSAGCKDESQMRPSPDSTSMKGTYAYDLSFLQKHTSGLIELMSDDSSSKILVSSEWQGRVMTSTAMGDSGTSFGWINYDLLSSGEKKKQFNPVGGEERFWIGPEGGQFSFYFRKSDSFSISNWQVPAAIDTIAYELSGSGGTQATFKSTASLKNYKGNSFNFSIERQVNLLNKKAISRHLGSSIGDGIHVVGYETINKITNNGSNDWTKETGLISIWLLGMFTPTPETIVIIPFHPSTDANTHISGNYFGPIPSERLKVLDSTLYFTCDGKYRSKIGLSPTIAKPLAASYDFAKNVLTVVIPEVHPSAPYVNSKWEQQKEPYKGDVINSYNDGPLPDGSQLGPFYEIESSSPAMELKRKSSGSYRQVTCHLQSNYPIMKQFVKEMLKVDLDAIKPKN